MEAFSALLTFVRGIHRSPVNSPHKGQWHRALMFSLVCARTNGWLHHRDAGDLRRHYAHYDVTLMYHFILVLSTHHSNPQIIVSIRSEYHFLLQSFSSNLWTWIFGSSKLYNIYLILSHGFQWFDQLNKIYMMTSSNGNIFRVTGHLCGEFTGLRWIPRTKASDAELWWFLWSASE